jgi:hypothetical protein
MIMQFRKGFQVLPEEHCVKFYLGDKNKYFLEITATRRVYNSGG